MHNLCSKTSFEYVTEYHFILLLPHALCILSVYILCVLTIEENGELNCPQAPNISWFVFCTDRHEKISYCDCDQFNPKKSTLTKINQSMACVCGLLLFLCGWAGAHIADKKIYVTTLCTPVSRYSSDIITLLLDQGFKFLSISWI